MSLSSDSLSSNVSPAISDFYADEFFSSRDLRTRYAAHQILASVFQMFGGIKSVIDIGCGVGTWLSVSKELGATTILGIDGQWVNQQRLVMAPECFQQADLENIGSVKLNNHFDLAICLEVAEHLPAACAKDLVCLLTSASDVILFSAAVPGQGGTHHVNEQWPDYWSTIFMEFNYQVLDVVRFQIWNDSKIPFWYRQNTLLFVKGKQLAANVNIPANTVYPPMRFIHPELYRQRIELSPKQAFLQFIKASSNALKRRGKSWFRRSKST